MVTWRALPEEASAAGWDAWVRSAEDANPFQAHAWAEHKRAAGWKPARWVAEADGAPFACMQALLKPLALGKLLAWCPGGPISGMTGCAPGLLARALEIWLEDFRRRGGVYARFRCHRPLAPAWAEALAPLWARPAVRINSGVTILHDLSKPLEALRAGMASKHRYYVKQAEKAALSWDIGCAETHGRDFTALYRQMAEAKGIRGLLFPLEAIESLRRTCGPDCLILLGRRDGRALTGCLTLLAGKSAFYLMAATGGEGRKLSAAYAMTLALFAELKARGTERFDFGGLAPGSAAAAGVDHFKRGFGGLQTEYLGEWDWASPSWLRVPASALAGLRGRGGL